jgi:hypothetical protein
MSPEFGQADLDAEIVFDRFLSDADLAVLQEELVRLAPKWSTRLRVWRGPRDQRPIDPADPGALGRVVLAAAGERGATYRRMVAEHGRGHAERLTGSAELRGAGPELVVVVSVDEIVLSTMGTRKLLGNGIALQVRRPTVARRPGADWLAETFETLCARLAPAWGHAEHPAEYWAKVMSQSPRVEAVGRDFGRYLPGVFWLNFYGPAYLERIGPDRFAALPPEFVQPVAAGRLVRLATTPQAWTTPDYAIDERRVRDTLGRPHFFEKP